MASLADLAAHNADPEAHSGLVNLVNEALGKVQILWDTIYAQVTGNAYNIKFDTLDGLIVEGVWNAALQRIEF